MFYEFKHSLSADYFLVEKGENFDYPAHMHHCFEFLCVLDGEMCVEVDDLQYTLGAGDALLIFPNQIHSMRTADRVAAHTLPVLTEARERVYRKDLLANTG